MREIDFMEVGGFQAGHAQNFEAGTGCTVFLFDGCAPAGVDIRGGGPASRETPLLDPRMHAQGLHGLLLSGGSAFGLDAAGGVMRYLEERGIGVEVGEAHVPLVCQSCIFDLSVGQGGLRPDGGMAYAACASAGRTPLANGCVGGGTGATVGKYRGLGYAMKSGFGACAVQLGGLKVGAAVVVNALGDVFDLDSGAQIAGLRTEDGAGLRSTEEEMWRDGERNQIPAGQDRFHGPQRLCPDHPPGTHHGGRRRHIRPVGGVRAGGAEPGGHSGRPCDGQGGEPGGAGSVVHVRPALRGGPVRTG